MIEGSEIILILHKILYKNGGSILEMGKVLSDPRINVF